jgi:cellulose synthase operon protein C
MEFIRKTVVRSGLPLVILTIAIGGMASPTASFAADENEKAMAAYADAANFQTNGAIPLAIEAWQKYLKDFPEDTLVSKAAHYLGVCYMQQAEPDYVAAIEAFGRAVKDPKSELREESLVNLGWCQFAAAGEGERRDPARLKAALDTFKTLIKEKPASKYADRALFYGGESAYGLGNAKEAVSFYDRLLAMDLGKESSLRCDALYARGIALEDLKRYDDAAGSYRQLLEACKDGQLATDARIRLGDSSILQKKHDDAIRWFGEVIAGDSPERPYALLRQAFAMVQADNPAEAAAVYERLVTEFPDSPYASAATLASAQTIYRAGDLDQAATRFERVLKLSDRAAATEAAHWLALISLRKGKPDAAIDVAKKQLDAGAEGAYAVPLRMDLAEATMLMPGQTAAAMDLFRSIYVDAADSPEASRALYNAAFAAMQLGRHEQSIAWAGEFIKKYPSDPLIADVKYISAESKLMSGSPADAADEYLKLITDGASKDKIQRPLWVMRGAVALSMAGKAEQAISLLEKDQAGFTPVQQGEAAFMVGTMHLSGGRGGDAVKAFERAVKLGGDWSRSDEANLQLGQAHLIAGDEAKAAAVWEGVIQRFPQSPRSDQARYRLGQAAARANRHAAAVTRYDEVLASGLDPSLKPLALYGKGWNLMRDEKPGDALAALDRLIAEHPEHPLAADARLARGMCLRVLGKSQEAVGQLESFLADDPQGINRGHALYELALIDQAEKRAAKAAERLQQLVAEVPNYPGMEKVIYEWAWSLKESGQDDAAEVRFKELIEKYPNDPMSAEGHYYLGQRLYAKEQWGAATASYAAAAKVATDPLLKERSLYRQGWAFYKAGQFRESTETFTDLLNQFPAGKFLPDALLMAGEGHFKLGQFDQALAAYEKARQRIIEQNETESNITELSDRQIREIVFLHGGQSLSQLKRWDEGIAWFRELKERFPNSVYLPQTDYELGYALQQSGKDDEALAVYEQVAESRRTEIGARARFMIGEIYFGRKDFAKAIPEFQRVMYGYGAEKASDPIKNWQAKSGYEAGRCAELMMQAVRPGDAKNKSAEIAAQFFNYVVQKHPKHELAPKSQERLEVLKRMGFDTSVKAETKP